MATDTLFVFALIGIAAAMMASNRVRFDFVALFVVVALIVSGVLSVNQALSGFGSPVVIMVACLLVVGEMLDRTGVARAMGNLILRHGGSNEMLLLVLLMVAAALLGSVMSSTAVVAIFIPIVLRVASGTGIRRSTLLLPMAYAALISGMLTLIATPANLVVSDGLADHGFSRLGFFSFLPIGAVVLAVALVYCLFVARPMLARRGGGQAPEVQIRPRSVSELASRYEVADRIHLVKVGRAPPPGFGGGLPGVHILARRRVHPGYGTMPSAFVQGMELRTGDQLLVYSAEADVGALVERPEFELTGRGSDVGDDWIEVVGAAEVMVHPEATVLGQSLSQILPEELGLEGLAILRGSDLIRDPADTRLRAKDRLLVAGAWDRIDDLLERTQDFVLLAMPSERQDIPPAAGKFGVALVILAGMVILSVSDLVPVVVAVLLAAVAAVMLRTMTAEAAYQSIHWSSVVLVAGMLPLADALEQTGGSQLIVDTIFDAVGIGSPRVVMGVLFLLTAVIGAILSNTATAVLLTPIAITAAQTMGVSPYPLAVTVLIAASAAFSTPVSTPVVTLVVTPGGYSFADFLKIGTPLTVLVGVLSVALIPLVFPF